MTDIAAPKPIRPNITAVNRPFWEGCGRGELLIQRCTSCSRLRYPAAAICPSCLGSESKWERVSGAGKVFSFVVFHRAYHPAWEDKVPYNVSLIELDEGPMMLSNVIGVDHETLKIGQAVQVSFDPIEHDLAIPVFKPTD
jgi:uncharacterized protein